MQNLSFDQVKSFANQKNIILSEDELEFTYNFIKKNWETIIGNPNLLNLDRYKDYYSLENFNKIKKLFNEYVSKYRNFL